MRTVLYNLFGSYEPISVVLDDGTTQYLSGLAGVDWEYILGVLLFALVLGCVLGIIRTVIKNA